MRLYFNKKTPFFGKESEGVIRAFVSVTNKCPCGVVGIGVVWWVLETHLSDEFRVSGGGWCESGAVGWLAIYSYKHRTQRAQIT